MTTSIRPPAVPLVTVDPYFSVWSMADRLTDDYTRHWTGKRNALTGLVRIDGVCYRIIGKVEPSAERYYTEPPVMEQVELTVTPLTTAYRFTAAGVEVQLDFTTPLLLDDLSLLSRPASYIQATVSSLDGLAHEVQLYIDVTGEWCVDTSDQPVIWGEEQSGECRLLYMQHAQQQILNRSGDDLRIDWGRFYLAVQGEGEQVQTGFAAESVRKHFARSGQVDFTSELAQPHPAAAATCTPVMASLWNCGSLPPEGHVSQLIVLAYDDEYSIEYFGDRLQALWKKGGVDAATMIAAAFAEYPAILERCTEFGRDLLAQATASGGAKYAELLVLAYRQAIAAHKLVEDTEGKLLFMSKECYSNGCIATVDVSYPSIPLFLLHAPELVKGMMRPIFRYAASDQWVFEFAPHDVGQYPLANGQVYAENARDGQMPIEECGNMLVMAAAVSLADGHADFAAEHWALLTQWAEYLVAYGLDPENQLCTDDFAGHLARNANLSVKAIMGIASYGLLHRMRGDSAEAERYFAKARTMAREWEQLAAEDDHYQLAFGKSGSWSLKYNLVWDILMETDIFAPEIAEKEVAWYLRNQDKYGVPLDSREHYTKADWLVWAATLATREDDFRALIEPLWKALDETPDRVPLCDWHHTETARQMNFQHRSVVGGLFIKVLKDRWLEAGQAKVVK